jgi:hypothetical protein
MSVGEERTDFSGDFRFAAWQESARFSYGRGVTLEAMALMRRGVPIPPRMREICMVRMRDHYSL